MFLDKVLGMIGKRFFEKSHFLSGEWLHRMKDSELKKYLVLSEKSFKRSLKNIKIETKEKLKVLENKYQERKTILNLMEKKIRQIKLSLEKKKEQNRLKEVNLKLLESLLLFKDAKNILKTPKTIKKLSGILNEIGADKEKPPEKLRLLSEIEDVIEKQNVLSPKSKDDLFNPN